MTLFAYTDYPRLYLGDLPNMKAPTRRVEVLSYDGDKYVTVRDSFGYEFDIKRGYLYSDPQLKDLLRFTEKE